MSWSKNNCKRLTKHQVIQLWQEWTLQKPGFLNMSEPRKKFGKFKNQLMVNRDDIEQYGKDNKFLKYERGGTSVHKDFRGFLIGGGWVVYVGDDVQLYFNTDLIIESLVDGDITDWEGFKDTTWNRFGVPYLIDATTFICGTQINNFINWMDEDPFEVKV